MALILYSNGLTEEYKPKNLVFTEDEFLTLFSEFPKIHTCRPANLLNTWCVYGSHENIADFNRVAFNIISEPVHTHVLFVHDSEINNSWNLRDDIIYKSYKEFLLILKSAIESTAVDIINEFNQLQESGKNDSLPQLSTLGTTADKKLLFAFDPDEQSKSFYTNEEFEIFSQKVYEYIKSNKQKKEPFIIYSDNKAIVIIDTKQIKKFLGTLIDRFKKVEDYEKCTHIAKIQSDWEKTTIRNKRSPKPRSPKNNKSNKNLDEQ